MPGTLETEFQPQARPATAMLFLRGRATYREAPELRRELFAAIEASRDKNLVIDLHGLERIDTAAMAVLVEGLAASRDDGPDLYLFHASESVSRVFELANLDDALLRCYTCWDDFRQAVTP